jgi:uncharacterized protein (UPF0332 family)
MNKEQKLLIEKAKESLKAAKILLNENIYAFSSSRSYYTMFYLAEVFLLENELNFSKHSAVISAFGNQFAKTGKVPKKYHKYLIESQNIRNTADYDTATITSKEDAITEIQKAEEFLSFTQEYLNNNADI